MRRSRAELILSRLPPPHDAPIEEQDAWHWLQYWAMRQQALAAKKFSDAISAQENMRAITLSPRLEKPVDPLETAVETSKQLPYSRVDQEADQIIRYFQETPYRSKDAAD